MSPGERFDVIVAGAGSSGGVLAARLSDDSARQVLLLEAGPDFPDEASNPPGFLSGGALYGEGSTGSGPPTPQLDWGYRSEELPGGRRVPLPRGRLVGGTSMVNGCVAVRGRPEDFERWVAAGAEGWGWSDVLPFYEAVELDTPIMRYPEDLWLPVQRLLVEGWRELGFRFVEDFNAPDSWDGVVGPWPRNRRNEVRQGTLVTHVRPARGRPNLTIRDAALVDTVVFDGSRATGVRYVDADGNPSIAGADLVVLSAGAYGTPAILLRSGVGPADELRTLGIRPRVNLPVGRHVMEHPGCSFLVATRSEYARMGWPALAVAARGDGWWAIPRTWDGESGLTAISMHLALVEGPDGSVRLRSTAPDAAPIIDHRYLDVIDGGGFDGIWRDFQRLLGTDAYARAGARDVDAGAALRDRLLAAVTTGTHPAGGASIGQVVDPQLAVYGTERLMVADASVFPRHVSNNPNLTCYMVGERAAAKIAAERAAPLSSRARDRWSREGEAGVAGRG